MALPNDMSRIADGLAKLEASGPSYDADEGSLRPARQVIRKTLCLRKIAADSMAADTTAYTAAQMQRANVACRIIGAYFIPEGTCAADNTDYATLKVVKGDGAAGAEVIMASGDTRAASLNGLAAGVTETLALSSTVANTRIPRGSLWGFSIAKAGAGKIVPAGTFVIDYEEEGCDAYAVG